MGDVAVHTLTRDQARRIAVAAQLLTEPRPDDLLSTVRHLAFLQADPTAHVAPSAELVAWSRLGDGYARGELDALLATGVLVELRGLVRPAEDLALYRAEMAAWPGPGPLRPWQEDVRDWVEANDHSRREILERLYDEGPLPTRELPDTTAVPWESSGWNNDRSLRMLLECLVARGEVAVAGRAGRDPLWDLAERVYPDGPTVPLDEARQVRAARLLQALGIARDGRRDSHALEDSHVHGAGEPAVVEGLRGRWRVDPAYLPVLDDDGFGGRVALLSPLDRLVFDRKRMADLFGFDYQLEMYKPAAKRRWGYWALPVLDDDALVGKVDATAERDRGVLRVDAVHEDDRWSATRCRAVRAEIEALAAFLDLEVEPADA